MSALGTSNTTGNGKATSVINIWAIYGTDPKTALGWIVKSFDGRLWYEDPLGLTNVDLSQTVGIISHDPKYSFVGCFNRDLDLASYPNHPHMP